MSAFSYGQSEARNHAHVATWACHLGTLETNIDALLAKVAATQSGGGKPTPWCARRSGEAGRG